MHWMLLDPKKALLKTTRYYLISLLPHRCDPKTATYRSQLASTLSQCNSLRHLYC